MKKIASIIMTMVMALFLAVGVSGASVKAASLSDDGSSIVIAPDETICIDNLYGNTILVNYNSYTGATPFTLDYVGQLSTTTVIKTIVSNVSGSIQVSKGLHCVITNRGNVPIVVAPYDSLTKLDLSKVHYYKCQKPAFDTISLQPGQPYGTVGQTIDVDQDVAVSNYSHCWYTDAAYYAHGPFLTISSKTTLANKTPDGAADVVLDVYVPNAPVEYVEPVDYSIVHPGGTVTFTNVDSTNTTFKCFDVSGANSVIDVDYVNYKPSGSVSLIERYSKTQPYSILTAGYYCVLTNNSSFDIVIKAYKTINGTPTEVSDKTKYNFASKTGPAFNVYSLQPGDTLDVTNAVMVTNRAHCLVTYTPNSGSPTVSYATTDMISLSAWKSVVILNDGTDPFDVYVPVE